MDRVIHPNNVISPNLSQSGQGWKHSERQAPPVPHHSSENHIQLHSAHGEQAVGTVGDVIHQPDFGI